VDCKISTGAEMWTLTVCTELYTIYDIFLIYMFCGFCHCCHWRSTFL